MTQTCFAKKGKREMDRNSKLEFAKQRLRKYQQKKFEAVEAPAEVGDVDAAIPQPAEPIDPTTESDYSMVSAHEDKLQQILKDQQKEIQALTAKLQREQDVQIALNSQIQQNKVEIEQLHNDLRVRDGRIASIEAEISKVHDKFDIQTKILAEKEDIILQLQKGNQEKQDLISKLHNEHAVASEARVLAQRRESELLELERILKEREFYVTSLQAASDDKDQMVSRLSNELESAKDKITKLENERANERHVHELNSNGSNENIQPNNTLVIIIDQETNQYTNFTNISTRSIDNDYKNARIGASPGQKD
jgi:chromosome segregation ATPase